MASPKSASDLGQESAAKTAARLIRAAGREITERSQADVDRRQADRRKILSPDDVLGKYNFKRELRTTLGGVLRPITDADLRDFQRNIKAAGKQYKRGITAQTVIDNSRPADLARGNAEIKFSVPLSHAAGRFQFSTNAGPNSNVTRHYVTIEFLNYSAALGNPRPSDKVAYYLTKSYLKFDCDCGRHRFWYRYISTIGGFNAGRDETGFPKIRNPQLIGVACKHVLRTMTAIQQPAFRTFLMRAVEQDRERVGRAIKAKKLRGKDIAEIAEEQLKGAEITTRQQQRDAKPAPTQIKRDGRPRPAVVAKAKQSKQAKLRKPKVSAQAAKQQADRLQRFQKLTPQQQEKLLSKVKG